MQTKTREWNMDYLRIFACFMVVFLHVAAAKWHGRDVNSSEWKIMHYYDTAVRSCVPLFFMLSGKLFLSKEQMVPISQLYRKNILKLLILYFAWALFYAVDTVGVTKTLAGNSFPLIWENILDAKYHLWYLPALIGIYVLLPLLWCVAKYNNGKYLKYACWMFLIFAIVKNTVFVFVKNQEIHAFASQFTYELSQYSGYFLLGYALDKYKEKFAKIKTWLLVTMLIVIIVLAGVIGDCYAVSIGKPSSILYGYLLLPAYLEACIIFLLFLRIPAAELNQKTGGIIRKISKYTLFIYLSHVFVLQHLQINLGITTLSLHPFVSVPVLAVAIFLFCLCIATVIDHIPIVRKWLM